MALAALYVTASASRFSVKMEIMQSNSFLIQERLDVTLKPPSQL
jgi:hypothetical protein